MLKFKLDETTVINCYNNDTYEYMEKYVDKYFWYEYYLKVIEFDYFRNKDLMNIIYDQDNLKYNFKDKKKIKEILKMNNPNEIDEDIFVKTTNYLYKYDFRPYRDDLTFYECVLDIYQMGIEHFLKIYKDFINNLCNKKNYKLI